MSTDEEATMVECPEGLSEDECMKFQEEANAKAAEETEKKMGGSG